MTSVTVGGLTFFNSYTPREDGVALVFDLLSGWHGGVSTRGDSTPRPGAHGDFAERSWRGARAPGLRGSAVCPSRAAAAVVADELAGVLADGSLGPFEVADPDQGTRTARVRLVAADVSWDRSSTVVDFDFQFLAPDPLRYGAPVTATTTFPVQRGGLEYDLYTDGAGTDLGYLDYGDAPATGTATLTNEGTADSWPIFEVTGPVGGDGFELVEVGTGRRIVFADSVPAGSSLVVDSAAGAGSAVIGGAADRGGSLTVLEWFPVPARGSTQVAFVPRGGTSAAVLSVSFSPAWW